MLLFNTFPQFLCGCFTEFKFLTLQKMIIKWASVTFRRTIFIWKKIFARLKNFEQTRICKLLLWIISIWVHFSLNLLFKSSSKCYFFVFACLSMTISVGVTSYEIRFVAAQLTNQNLYLRLLFSRESNDQNNDTRVCLHLKCGCRNLPFNDFQTAS